MQEFRKGLTALLFDEAFTIHPLIMSCLITMCEDAGVPMVFVGEALQVTSKQDRRYLEQGWHERYAFMMLPWQRLEQSGRLLYVKLTGSYRLPQAQFDMLMQVRRICSASRQRHCLWSMMLSLEAS